MNRLFVVGDSTLAKFNDETYLFPRFGYATKLDKYFDLEIINLALSGRSSLSFLKEKNYEYLCNNLSDGDYLLIGFGHNDEKSDDASRFTSAKLDINNEKSFIYTINHYYVELARKKKATPIIATPISRITRGLYEGFIIHDTENGNYKDVLIKYGNEYNVEVINLTDVTKKLYEDIGFDNAKYHHAITKANGILNNEYLISDNAVDKTHLSEYGALVVSYLFINELSNHSALKKHLKKEIYHPSKKDIIINPKFKYIKYFSPNLKTYKNVVKYNNDLLYYTSFGKVSSYEGMTIINNDKLVLTDLKENGRIVFSSTAGVFLFKQIKKEDNFICKAKLRVLGDIPLTESAFGLMLRDDCYIDYDKDKVITSNEILCGLHMNNSSLHLGYVRYETTSIERLDVLPNQKYVSNDVIECEISRLGQRINTKLVYKDKIMEKEYLDFDLFIVDNEYSYIGIFNAKNEKVIVEEFDLKITNKAMEA